MSGLILSPRAAVRLAVVLAIVTVLSVGWGAVNGRYRDADRCVLTETRGPVCTPKLVNGGDR